jgi:hypothetical protein
MDHMTQLCITIDLHGLAKLVEAVRRPCECELGHPKIECETQPLNRFGLNLRPLASGPTYIGRRVAETNIVALRLRARKHPKLSRILRGRAERMVRERAGGWCEACGCVAVRGHIKGDVFGRRGAKWVCDECRKAR